jgi:hypothetical protein
LSIFDAQSFIAPRETLTETKQTAKPNPIGPKEQMNGRTDGQRSFHCGEQTNKPAADSDLMIGQRNASGIEMGWLRHTTSLEGNGSVQHGRLRSSAQPSMLHVLHVAMGCLTLRA